MSNNDKGATPQHPLDEWAAAGWQQLSSAEATISRQRLKQRLQAQRTQTRPTWGKWMAVAASIALLLAVGQRFYMSPENGQVAMSTATGVHQTVDHPMPVGILSPQRSAEQAHTAELLVTATTTYQNRAYAEASSLFQAYLEQNEKHVEVALFLGHAQLQHDPTAAKQTLVRFLSKENIDQVLVDYANCFLALAQIRTDEKKLGTKTLEAIANDPQHPLQILAQQELTTLK